MKIRNAYEKLYDHYNYMASKAITEKQKKQYKKYLVKSHNFSYKYLFSIHQFKQPPMKLIIPEYINKENNSNPEARQGNSQKY